MKKLIYTSIAAVIALSSLTAVAAAASSGLLGKKVQGVIPVEINGKTVKDAVIIDGTTYAPVRSLSDAAGFDLSIEGGKVKVTSNITPTNEDKVVIEQAKIKQKIQVLKNGIESNKESIRIAESESIAQLEKRLAEEKAYTTDVEIHKTLAEGVQRNLDEQRAYVADLQKKIDAANAEIAQLESQLK